MTGRRRLIGMAVVIGLAASSASADTRLSGRIDLRAVSASAGEPWAEGGPGKQRYASGRDLQLSHGVLVIDWQHDARPLDARLVLHAADDRPGVVDATEVFLRWRPVPEGPWRTSLRAGAFFPEISRESSGLGWTPTHGLSTSASNAWIGEELRTIGIEASWSRAGRFADSPHDWLLSTALFGGNDTTGALLAWRGWTVGDRLTGLRERIALPALPAFEATGGVAEQVPWTNPFREIDGRVGAYVLLGHAHAEGWRSRLWLYDNFADPSILKSGQYSWHTRFAQGWIERRWAGGTTLALQSMWGTTAMGPRRQLVVDNGYRATSLHVEHEMEHWRWGARLEWFDVSDRDATADDPNAESGRAAVLHLTRPWGTWESVFEASRVDSSREARMLLDRDRRRIDGSVSIALRRDF